MTVLRRVACVLASAVGGLGATAMLVGAPAAAQPGRCASGTGVTVVVDYGSLGGGTQIGCDPSGAGKPGSQVVPAAGFSLTYVNGEGFVCRIEGKPDASHESCARTPPEDAYWALFWSDGKSSTWKYSSIGVGGLKVPKGGSIGWRFEDGGPRQVPGQPPTRAADQPSPSPSKSPKPTQPPRPAPSTAPDPGGPSPSPSAHTPPASSAPPVGGAATPTPPTGGPAEAAPRPGGSGKGTGDGSGKGGKGSGTGDGKGDRGGKGGKGGKPGHHRKQASRDQVVASADTDSTAQSDSGQKVLTAMAASSVVLLGAAVGVAGWRRRS